MSLGHCEGTAVDTLVEIVSPGFLLRDALIGSVLVEVMCPWSGCISSSDA